MTNENRCQICGEIYIEGIQCPGCAKPKPFVDLTTAGASVDPQTLLNDPRYVPQPDMPDGEPDYHELVVMVHNLCEIVGAQVLEITSTYRLLQSVLPEGEPDYHKLVFMVRDLEKVSRLQHLQLKTTLEVIQAHEQEIAALKAILRTTHVELVQGDLNLDTRMVRAENKIGEIVEHLDLRDPSFCPSRD